MFSHPIDRTSVTHIMTSTRRLRRIENENQIWLVIPYHCAYDTGQKNEILMKLHYATSFFYVFVWFIGKTLGGSQVRTGDEETAMGGIHWNVVHAPGDTLKGAGARKEGDKDSESVSTWEGRTEKVKTCLQLLWDVGIAIEMNCGGYDTIVLLSMCSHTSLHEDGRVNLSSHMNTKREDAAHAHLGRLMSHTG